MPEEDDASRRSKSLDGDATIGNSALIARHYGSKVSTLISHGWDGCGNELAVHQFVVTNKPTN